VLRRFASPPIRNAGTLAGNVANGSPIGDSIPPLIALGARVVLRKGAARRELPLEALYLAYQKTAVEPGEFVERVRVPVRQPSLKFATYKISKRFDQDISAVCAAFAIAVEGARSAPRGCVRRHGRDPQARGRARRRSPGRPGTRRPASAPPPRCAGLHASQRHARVGRLPFDGRAELAAEVPSRDVGRARREPEPPVRSRGGARMNDPRPPREPAAALGAAGAPVRHDSAHLHVSGEAAYTDDILEARGTLHAAFGLSRRAHARIRSMDLSGVRAAPGVVTVLTAADIPGENNVGPILHDDPILAVDEVQFLGQPIFLVVAESVDAARRAARLGAIEYEDLPAILTIEDALAKASFVIPSVTLQRGDWQAALAAAPYRLKGGFRIGGQEQFYLEGQVAYAVPKEDGDMLVYSSTQHPGEVQRQVAHALGWRRTGSPSSRRMGGVRRKETQASHPACATAGRAR
jgi:hypothetical protein